MSGVGRALGLFPSGLLLAACLWVSPVAGAHMAGSPADEISALETRIAILATIDHLSLTPQQLQLLFAQVRKAQEIRGTYEREWAPLAVEQETAFSAFFQEDLANVGFTPEVERRTARANEQGKQVAKQFCEQINALEWAVYNGLTPEQQAFLRGERLGRRAASAPALAAAPASRADMLQEELAAIHAEVYGAIGPIGKLLLCPYAEEMVCLRLGQTANEWPVASGQPVGAQGLAPLVARIRELRNAINLQNLVNGLNLSLEQIPSLIEAAQVVAPARDNSGSVSSQPDPLAAPAYRNALYGVLSSQAQRQPISPRVLQQLPRLRRQAFGGSSPLLSPADRRGLEGLRERCARQVAAALTLGQRQVLIDFNPCLIPPKNLKDPVRAGQARDNTPLISLLERLRRLPEGLWQISRDEILDRALARVEEHQGHFPEDERERVLAQMAAVTERVRGMTDVEFSLSGEELAQELRVAARKETVKDELRAVQGEDRVLMSKIRSFLLDPQIIPLLGYRARQLRAGPTTQPVDLDSLLPPPGCADGSCAIDEGQ